jgi:hypothetical protein
VTQRRVRSRPLVFLLAFAVLAIARGGSAATAPSVSFVTPSDGSTVAGPRVEVALRVGGIKLVPAGSLETSGQGHAHVLVDRAAPGAREFLSTDDPQIVHLGKPPLLSRAIPLSSGQHTLVAILGDSEHLVVRGQRTQTIHITVAPGFRGKGALTPACSDVAAGAGQVRLTFPTDGGAVQGTISTACVFVTQGGACTWLDAGFSRISGTFDTSAQRITGQASGTTQRQLRSGSKQSCGQDRETSLAPSEVQGQLANDTVSGTLGPAQFTVGRDDSVDLAPEPMPLQSAAQAKSVTASKRSPLVYAIFVAAAALLVFAIVSALRPRRA